MDSAARRLRAKGLHLTTDVEWGDPESHIVDVARQWHADLIVVGSHGRKGLEHFLLGSVSETVARYAPCSARLFAGSRSTERGITLLPCLGRCQNDGCSTKDSLFEKTPPEQTRLRMGVKSENSAGD